MALGILELVCTVGLIVPAAFHWQPALTVVAATVLAIESLVFIGVHVKYREITPIIMSGVLGLLMAFIAYGRLAEAMAADAEPAAIARTGGTERYSVLVRFEHSLRAGNCLPGIEAWMVRHGLTGRSWVPAKDLLRSSSRTSGSWRSSGLLPASREKRPARVTPRAHVNLTGTDKTQVFYIAS